jgi:hypothetical protein
MDVLSLTGTALPVPRDGLFLLRILALNRAPTDADGEVGRRLDRIDDIATQRATYGVIHLGPAGPDPDVILTDMKRA